MYKKELHSYLKIINRQNENILWISVDKKILGIENNLKLGTVYISPINSSVHKRDDNTTCWEDIYNTLYMQLASFNNEHAILLGGDFNARTGNLKDFIENEENENNFIPFSENFADQTFSNLRVNQDKKVNQFGYELRDICIGANLRILNGRTLGDLTGKYTYIGKNGCSTVDYVLASENIMSSEKNTLTDFIVEDLNIFSEHRPLSLSLHNYNYIDNENKDNNKLIENSRVRKWAFKYGTDINKIIENENLKKSVEQIIINLNNFHDNEIIDKAMDDIERLFPDVSKKPKTVKNNIFYKKDKNLIEKKQQRREKAPWFSFDCQKLKRQLNYTCKAVNKDPSNPYLRGNFYTLRKKYRKLIKFSKSKFDQKIINDLEISSIERNSFWNNLKNIRKSKQPQLLPDPIDLQSHFSKLYSVENKNKVLTQVIDEAKENGLMNEISIDEIKSHIRSSKNKKSTGEDGISNEFLKNSNDLMLKLYKSFFNKIIETEKYPISWNTSITQLIHKEGPRDDPSHFRGIALTSNLAKIFNAIITTRITNYLEINNLIAPEQGGFRKDYRTTDHIFVLQTIIHKYLNKGEKLYTCFVDLKKAFDSVWREGLIYKLGRIGLGKKIINLISDMYHNTYTSIIYHNKILPKINTTKGVKQGDNLSPLLFNIFINDLPETIKIGNTQPVQLHGVDINSILWADDIVLISETKDGLQKCINNLYNYCKEWTLEINIEKTKTIIFNKSGKNIKSIRFQIKHRERNINIQNVNEYPYLGFTISASGKFHIGI